MPKDSSDSGSAGCMLATLFLAIYILVLVLTWRAGMLEKRVKVLEAAVERLSKT